MQVPNADVYGWIFFAIWCIFVCFLWFWYKTSSVFYPFFHLRKTQNVIERCFISFPGSLWLHEKGTPLELTLSSFHDSLNMKRLPSDLAIFMLVKVFEVTRPSKDNLTLFRSRWTIVWKRNWESSLLSVFPNSIILKNFRVFYLWTR